MPVPSAFDILAVRSDDADAMRRKHALRDTLNAFKARKLDLLVGTQMIAKGLHFPNVTLVGIVYADLSLHMADFRAGERTSANHSSLIRSFLIDSDRRRPFLRHLVQIFFSRRCALGEANRNERRNAPCPTKCRR